MDTTIKQDSRWSRLLQAIGVERKPVKTKADIVLPPPTGFWGTGFVIKGLATKLNKLYASGPGGLASIDTDHIEGYFEDQLLLGAPLDISHKDKYYSIRLGFVLRFINDGNEVKLSQKIADVARKVENSPLGEEIVYETVIKISEYPIGSNLIDDSDESPFSLDWYQFQGTNLEGMTSSAGIVKNAAQLEAELLALPNILENSIINLNPTESVYTKLDYITNPNFPYERLEFYNPEVNLDLVFFSDADFSLLHGRITKANGNLFDMNRPQHIAYDIFFSGAKINIGRVAGAYSQIELVGTNKEEEGQYPIGDDFTLKAEVIQRKIHDSGQSSPFPYPGTITYSGEMTGSSQASSALAREVFNENPQDENSDKPTRHSDQTSYYSPLPLVILGLPCPKIWEINEDEEPG